MLSVQQGRGGYKFPKCCKHHLWMTLFAVGLPPSLAPFLPRRHRNVTDRGIRSGTRAPNLGQFITSRGQGRKNEKREARIIKMSEDQFRRSSRNGVPQRSRPSPSIHPAAAARPIRMICTSFNEARSMVWEGLCKRHATLTSTALLP